MKTVAWKISNYSVDCVRIAIRKCSLHSGPVRNKMACEECNKDSMTYTLFNSMRNQFRFRRTPRRTITPNLVDLGVLEQLMAIRLGLAEDVRE